MTAWQPILVEFLRFGGDIGILRKGDRYLVARANEPVREFTMELDHDDFLTRLDLLRYVRDASPEEEKEAISTLAGVVTRMLALEPQTADVQVDLVLTAQELLTLPFEAAEASDGEPLVFRDGPTVEITRRVRGAFRDHASEWPSKPRVLFAAASPEQSVPTEEHKQALRRSLDPWIEPLEEAREATRDERNVLTLLEQTSLRSLRETCALAADRPYTHIHLLAHGCVVDPGITQKYGVTLHADDGAGAATATASELVEALAAGGRLPTVVMLAACDSANVGSPVVIGSSLSHSLHAAGVPVVLGSQFPLTVVGSTIATASVYGALFAGDDVRDAIHKARRAVYDQRAETGHDWMSLVAYVQLPEGYHDRLIDVRLEAELASLRTAQNWADELSRLPAPPPETYERVADRLRERIASLSRWVAQPENADRSAALDENRGLLGSAYKRLAELLFDRARLGDDPEGWKAESRVALEEAHGWYGRAFEQNLSAHWLGVQQLTLEVVLDGRIAKPWQWHAALAAAETACASDHEYWACGSRAELHLLAPYAGQRRQIAEAVRALREMKQRVGPTNRFPIESTARQLARYTTWWTSDNGLFANQKDLVQDAGRLVDEAG